MLNLAWSQVDFEAETVRLEPQTTKNDEGRTFPSTYSPASKQRADPIAPPVLRQVPVPVPQLIECPDVGIPLARRSLHRASRGNVLTPSSGRRLKLTWDCPEQPAMKTGSALQPRTLQVQDSASVVRGTSRRLGRPQRRRQAGKRAAGPPRAPLSPEGVAGPADHRTDPRTHRLARFAARGGWGQRTSAGGQQRNGDLGYGERTVLSLATAIDMLWPCHWDYVQNLETVLGVIGGDPNPRRPFAFCARNIKRSPIRERMKTVSHTLQAFYQDRPPDDDMDADLLASLGEPSRQRQWLASSLDKTIRLQMDL